MTDEVDKKAYVRTKLEIRDVNKKVYLTHTLKLLL